MESIVLVFWCARLLSAPRGFYCEAAWDDDVDSKLEAAIAAELNV
jgi:hypothetical protein